MQRTAVAMLMAFFLTHAAAESAAPQRGEGRAPAAPKRQDIQKLRESLLSHLDGRIEILQEARRCVQAAADLRAMNDCHQRERRRTKALREQARGNLFQEREQTRKGGS